MSIFDFIKLHWMAVERADCTSPFVCFNDGDGDGDGGGGDGGDDGDDGDDEGGESGSAADAGAEGAEGAEGEAGGEGEAGAEAGAEAAASDPGADPESDFDFSEAPGGYGSYGGLEDPAEPGTAVAAAIAGPDPLSEPLDLPEPFDPMNAMAMALDPFGTKDSTKDQSQAPAAVDLGAIGIDTSPSSNQGFDETGFAGTFGGPGAMGASSTDEAGFGGLGATGASSTDEAGFGGLGATGTSSTDETGFESAYGGSPGGVDETGFEEAFGSPEPTAEPTTGFTEPEPLAVEPIQAQQPISVPTVSFARNTSNRDKIESPPLSVSRGYVVGRSEPNFQFENIPGMSLQERDPSPQEHIETAFGQLGTTPGTTPETGPAVAGTPGATPGGVAGATAGAAPGAAPGGVAGMDPGGIAGASPDLGGGGIITPEVMVAIQRKKEQEKRDAIAQSILGQPGGGMFG